MTLDGKIATPGGVSQWITGERARRVGMRLRLASDAVLVGINTVQSDDPSLTLRGPNTKGRLGSTNPLRRIVLDAMARTPLTARVVADEQPYLTTIVVSTDAPKTRVNALSERARVMVAPPAESAVRTRPPAIHLGWLLGRLGAEGVTGLLVEGGGEVNASFLRAGHAHRVAFFYAPMILGGRLARKAVGGTGASQLEEVLRLEDPEWQQCGADLLLTARIGHHHPGRTGP
jgi:diaminohydroxyphosphoribosylaminopyrimidine deaminase/5-amino-6-(5-phosphoribosylamino)uracil reductase